MLSTLWELSLLDLKEKKEVRRDSEHVNSAQAGTTASTDNIPEGGSACSPERRQPCSFQPCYSVTPDSPSGNTACLTPNTSSSAQPPNAYQLCGCSLWAGKSSAPSDLPSLSLPLFPPPSIMCEASLLYVKIYWLFFFLLRFLNSWDFFSWANACNYKRFVYIQIKY